MAGSKKQIRQKEIPESRTPATTCNPEAFYAAHPSWCFSSCDRDMWPMDEAHVGEIFWNELFPRLKNLESQTWSEILVVAKKQNHTVTRENLNAVAQKRLAELKVEADALISLRITGAHRIYGLQFGSAFHVLWIDLDHGDNPTCVCRSTLKHT